MSSAVGQRDPQNIWETEREEFREAMRMAHLKRPRTGNVKDLLKGSSDSNLCYEGMSNWEVT